MVSNNYSKEDQTEYALRDGWLAISNREKSVHISVHIGDWSHGLVVRASTHNVADSQPDVALAWLDRNFHSLQHAPEPEIRAWFNTIPPELVQIVQGYDMPFRLLAAAARNPSGEELLRSSPTLYWLILSTHYETQRADFLGFGVKRVQLLHDIGLPPRKSVLKAIDKLDFQEFSCHALEGITSFLTSRHLQFLTHCPRFNETFLDFYNTYPFLAGGQFMVWVSKDGPLDLECRRVLVDTLRMGRELGDEPAVKRRISMCSGAKDLTAVHDSLTKRINALKLSAELKIKFPDPPLRPPRGIEPIENAEELFTEGKTQRNCVWVYRSRILRREYYVYRMRHPERATIGLQIFKDGAVELAEINMASNQPVAFSTVQHVQRWIRTSQQPNPARSQYVDERERYNHHANEYCRARDQSISVAHAAYAEWQASIAVTRDCLVTDFGSDRDRVSTREPH